MLYGARARAKKSGVVVTITERDIRIPEVCPALGIPLVFGIGAPSPNSPSLDRFYPDRGYIPGNVVVISHLANLIKKRFTAKELRTDTWRLDARVQKQRAAVAQWMANCEAVL